MSTIAALVAIDLMDESTMQDAERQLSYDKQNGIDETVIDISGAETGSYPESERSILEYLLSRGKEFKTSKERPEDYLTRLITKGDLQRTDDKLYVTKGDVCLEFRILHATVKEREETRTYYDVDEHSCMGGMFVDLHDVRGKVTVREHRLSLEYTTWHDSSFPRTETLPNPHRVQFRR